MVEQEEKRWLRALLEGEVEPGRLRWWRWESEDGYRSGEWKENRWLW